MPGTSNFLQWNPTSANQETDAAYSGDPQRQGGAAVDSIFPSTLANKLFYQLSTFVAAFGQMLASKNYSPSDASLSSLSSLLAAVMTQADMGPWAKLVSPAFTGTPTVPTAPANDNSTEIANTAWATGMFPKFSQFSNLANANGNGYQVFPGPYGGTGIVMQWGYYGLPTGYQDVVPFNIKFPNQCMVVIASDAGTYSNQLSQCNIVSAQIIYDTGIGRDPNSFRCFSMKPDGSQTFRPCIINWFAVGN